MDTRAEKIVNGKEKGSKTWTHSRVTVSPNMPFTWIRNSYNKRRFSFKSEQSSQFF